LAVVRPSLIILFIQKKRAFSMLPWLKTSDTDFYWVIRGVIAGMSHPGNNPEVLERLSDMGIGAVVSLTERPMRADLVRGYGMEFLHLPVPDFCAPRQEQIDQFVSFSESIVAQDRAVTVHCLAGRGRTGTMLGCFLVRQGMTANEAIDKVRSLRPGAIENFEQETAVYHFASREENGETPAHPEHTD
jgi:atypical dual specificity phosphatase